MMEKAVEVVNLAKHFGRVKAVNGISFEVSTGEIFGLIGPNGAGKTTTLRIISTLLKITSGDVKVLGHDVTEEPYEVRKVISYLPEEAGAYKNLSGRGYLEFMATFYSTDHERKRDLVDKGTEIAQLGERIYDKVSSYSKGMIRKLLVARALMVSPRLAILDEPTSGLDVINSREIREIIKNSAKRGMTVLLSSHNMLEVEFLCDRVGLIHQGILVETGTPEELKNKYKASNIEEVFVEAVR